MFGLLVFTPVSIPYLYAMYLNNAVNLTCHASLWLISEVGYIDVSYGGLHACTVHTGTGL